MGLGMRIFIVKDDDSFYCRENQASVDARHKFARKRYAREYRWEPSLEVEAAIRKAIFGRIETGRS